MQDQELQLLRRDITRLPSGRRRRFPPALRARIIAWVASRRTAGAPWSALAAELGIPAVPLQAWEAAGPAAASPRLVPVEVAEAAPAPAPAVTVTLVSPAGWHAQGVMARRRSWSSWSCMNCPRQHVGPTGSGRGTARRYDGPVTQHVGSARSGREYREEFRRVPAEFRMTLSSMSIADKNQHCRNRCFVEASYSRSSQTEART